MKSSIHIFLVPTILGLFFSPACFSQGLEGIIVEEYFLNDGSSGEYVRGLPKNAVTYRIFADLEPGYVLQTLFAETLNPLRIETTTYFYNHKWGTVVGEGLTSTMTDSTAYMLDSYITIGAASDRHMGVPLSEDPDGSLLDNKLFRESDGLMESGKVPDIVYWKLERNIFTPENASIFETNDFLIGVFGGVRGPTEENRVLIAQLTTDGELSFELNVQVAKPGEQFIQYTARESYGSKIRHEDLTFGIPKTLIQ